MRFPTVNVSSRRVVPFGVITALGLLAAALGARAQSAGDLLLHDQAFHVLERLAIQGRLDTTLATETRPLEREQVARLLANADTSGLGPRTSAWLHRTRWRVDDRYASSRDTGLLRYFFRNHRDLLHYESDAFRIYVNPLIHSGLGYEQYAQNVGEPQQTQLYRNFRGAAIRGSILGDIGFYANLMDHQARFPTFTNRLIERRASIPGEQFYKRFGEDGYDYLSAKGYLTYRPSQHFRAKLGRDQAQWGPGYQSLWLSDHATEAYLLNLRTSFWKLEYVNHFTMMTDYLPGKPDSYGRQPRKWGAFHALYFRPMQGLSIGAFESIIYAPQLPGGRRGFELEYLNPLIFYRSVEQAIGSPDNAALGLSARWHFLQRFQLYGQFMLDDFNIARTQEGSGYWGNKFGLQGGLKWIDIGGVETLDLQLEYNHLRPYLYSHFNTSANYAHYNQPLAHPQGANAREGVVIVRYRPVSRLRLMMTGGWLRQGRDRNGLNFGGDIFRSNASHDNGEANPDYGNEITQGRRRTLFRLHGRISYQLFRLPLWLEGELYVRDDQTYTNTAALLSLRWGLPARPVRY